VKEAREAFQQGKDHIAEPLLQQQLKVNSRNPEVYQMLATIAYNKGQFNKAINTFKKALEIDPSYTDASVGLSIILNDLGRYDEAKKVFTEAKQKLDRIKSTPASWLDDKISSKHEELAELYMQSLRPQEALSHILKALSLSPLKKNDLTLRKFDIMKALGQEEEVLEELCSMVQAEPYFIASRLKLANLYYERNQLAEAVEHWEKILTLDPRNGEALQKLKMAQTAGITDIGL
jgi:tetratricopeptide (TPR) repeat protein